MARKKTAAETAKSTAREPKKLTKKNAAPKPRRSSGIALPPKERRKAHSVGVTNVRRQEVENAGTRGRLMRPATAAVRCDLFPSGAAAFCSWLRTTHGIGAGEKKSEAEWRPFLEEFAARPIHGHRRQKAGGNHRINPTHRR